jgi:TRAP-type mannitol/chloroaromatic compound transport system substrate-binding protein
MKRRSFLTGAAAAGASAAAASRLPAPAIAEGRMEWRMVTTWPKNFPGLGTGAELLAKLIARASGGRLTVKVYGAGDVVPAFEAMDAVASGTVEMGHGAPYYWKGKVPAAQYFAAIPFGLTAQEQNAWLQYGGGQELADEVYGELGCVFFPSGNTGVQMGGWFNREIDTLADFNGLKMRMPGLGGEVVRAVGGNIVNLPGGDIPTALHSGTVDAAEWVGPYNDLAFGLYQNAKYYYYPGWHEPGTVLDCFVNRRKFEALAPDLQAIIRTANVAVNQLVLSEFVARNNAALDRLVSEHGVELKPFPDHVLRDLGRVSQEVVEQLTSRDSLSRKVFASIVRFRREATDWSRLSDQLYLHARRLTSAPRAAG